MIMMICRYFTETPEQRKKRKAEEERRDVNWQVNDTISDYICHRDILTARMRQEHMTYGGIGTQKEINKLYARTKRDLLGLSNDNTKDIVSTALARLEKEIPFWLVPVMEIKVPIIPVNLSKQNP
jgi:hypothetical protein